MAGMEVRTSCSIDDLLKCQEEINRKLIIMIIIMLSVMAAKIKRTVWYCAVSDHPKDYLVFAVISFSLQRQ